MPLRARRVVMGYRMEMRLELIAAALNALRARRAVMGYRMGMRLG